MAKPFADFSSFKLEDFINDPDFVLWVTSSDSSMDEYWAQVQANAPQTKSIIKEARQIILSLRFKSESMTAGEQQQLWNDIKSQVKFTKKPLLRLPLWLRSAAALFFLCLGVFFYLQQQKLQIRTSFGQRKNLLLPDGSEVILNANSVLRYQKKWDKEKAREVWVEGEAFFKVNHLHRMGLIKQGERFIVHAQKLNIEVLGTSFNVNNRRGLIKVALITGKVRINVEGLNDSQLKMIPGELAEYKNKTRALFKKKVIVKDYSDWKSGRLHFNNTPLQEVLLMIEDNYNYKAILKNPAIGQRKLSGSFSSSSEDVLFKTIAVSLGISIQKDPAKHQLIIK